MMKRQEENSFRTVGSDASVQYVRTYPSYGPEDSQNASGPFSNENKHAAQTSSPVSEDNVHPDLQKPVLRPLRIHRYMKTFRMKVKMSQRQLLWMERNLCHP
ncbi:hypothetical protein JTB14_030415 [Gonioctena quinquepunctata]|nr:hypothetical protein JTB14_030415 [Gonioctena quinquepunctata]